ncbi:MAG: methyltransferase domain-containing protein [Alicyclobacillaceae bacterium]|nr:methyltransferase domain-containing protein [Alicyclobacillaceae bacterium]
MARTFTHQEIREKYERMARWYDIGEGIPEVLGLRRLRRALLAGASGDVLEVAVGTGKNLPFYPADCRITAVDLSPSMIETARRRAKRLGRPVDFHVQPAEALTFPDGRFDTVVSSMSLCTFPDPVQALREMARVCRKGGRILLLEHGRSDREWLGRWQDRRADRHAETLGCHWNRRPVELIEKAGLTPVRIRRFFLGIFHMIEIVV